MTIDQVIIKLKSLASPENIKKKERFGIYPKNAIGVLLADLKVLAKEIGKNEALGKALFYEDIYEARLLTAYVFPPKALTSELMEEWVVHFNNWEICDGFCMNLFAKSKNKALLLNKITEWTEKEEEFIKRAGFVIMTCYSLNFKKEENNTFENFYPTLLREVNDNRVYVKKAISWALRTFGKRNIDLNASAIHLAKVIQQIDSPSAQWIAKDVLKELQKTGLSISGYPRSKYQRMKLE